MTAAKNHDFIDLTMEDVPIPKYLESQLCVPQDRLEDIDFFPNFDDGFIRLTEELLPELDFLTAVDDDIRRKQESGDVESNCFDNNRKVSVDSRELSSLDSEEHSFDDCALQVSSQHNNINNYSEVSLIKNKKPRTKKPRNENQKLMFPLFVPKLKIAKWRRSCVHCQAEKTPQWRLGPMGPNTLCNACGLRYKLGRLLPEYRPAASPSFDSTKHSNFYRRIVQKKLSGE